VQTEEPVLAEKVPAAQLEQVDEVAPVVEANFPSAQLVQLSDPAFVA